MNKTIKTGQVKVDFDSFDVFIETTYNEFERLSVSDEIHDLNDLYEALDESPCIVGMDANAVKRYAKRNREDLDIESRADRVEAYLRDEFPSARINSFGKQVTISDRPSETSRNVPTPVELEKELRDDGFNVQYVEQDTVKSSKRIIFC
jgi:hypothetical protein